MDAILRRLVTLEPPSLKVFAVETVLLILRLPRRGLGVCRNNHISSCKLRVLCVSC